MKGFLVPLFSLFTLNTFSQANPSPCSFPEATEFDFWLGTWELTWNDTMHGTNYVEKILDGCTVQENFTDPATNFTGKSWSVYDLNYNRWQQTWVDNKGGYIVLTGNMIGD